MNMIGLVTTDNKWGIGSDNKLMYHIPEEFELFKEKTNDAIIVMGRKTYELLPDSRKFNNKIRVVLSRTIPHLDCAHVCDSVESLLTLLDFSKFSNKDVYVIGGEDTYHTLLPYFSEIHITRINTVTPEVDAYFPDVSNLYNWKNTYTSANMLSVNSALPFHYELWTNVKYKGW